MRDVEEDASGEEDNSSHGRGRLHGMRAPAEEYWSDDDSAGGPRTAPAEDASAEAHPRGGPWVAQAQRRLGGPRVDEPVSGRLLARLLVYALAFSACLTVCEVLTMWLSRRVSGALHTGLLTSVLWGAVRCACLCGLPYWCARPARRDARAPPLTRGRSLQLLLCVRLAEAPGGLEGARRSSRRAAPWLRRAGYAVCAAARAQEAIPPRRKVLDGASPRCTRGRAAWRALPRV
jgi:hypothetical protein